MRRNESRIVHSLASRSFPPVSTAPLEQSSRKRIACTSPVAVLALALLCLNTSCLAFGFEDVGLRAKRLAETSYKKEETKLPKELEQLGYDQYRDIRFRPEKFLWRGAKLPFEIAFFHPGLYYDQAVRMNEVAGGAVREIKFDPKLFDYGANKLEPQKLRGLSFAGFRVHYLLNTPKYKDEVLAFLGASYFRALGTGQLYGASARGLAVDTGLISGEEFPRFVEFWIERPEPNAKELTIYGLLDSKRMTGAYRFVVRPGVDTAIDVKARLFLRENVTKLGLSPLSSMFFFGENQRAVGDDYRPEVHDSDGLQIHSGTGEWLWRPLSNPKRLLVTSFTLTNPVGFGLMQRDRDFAHYEDLEARYDRRPSAWVESKGRWGAGRVELVQIPSPDETNDNVVAYWVPDAAPALQKPYEFEYRLLWQKDAETRPPQSWVVQSRWGHGYRRNADKSIGLVIDFQGPALKKLGPEAPIESVLWVDPNAEVLERVTHYNEVTGGWRVVLRLKRLDDSKTIELRCHLRDPNGTMSETWSYILPPG